MTVINFAKIRPVFFSRHAIPHCPCITFTVPHIPLPIYIPCYTIRINHLHLLQLHRVIGPWCGSVRVDNSVTPYILIWSCWTFRLPHVYNHSICTTWRGILDTNLSVTFVSSLVISWYYISSIDKSDRHNIGITEILWKEALIQQLPYLTYLFSYINSLHYLENHYVA